MKKNIIIPRFVADGIRKNSPKLASNILLFGADTETVNGAAHTLQISGKDGTFLYYVSKLDILETLLEHIDRRLKRGQMAGVYFHFLNFDLPVVFSNEKMKLWQASQFEVERHDWRCYVNCEKQFFAKFSKHGHKTIYVIDSFAFLKTSLEKIAKILKLPESKLAKPEGLGEIALRTKEFEDYAKRDAVIEYAFAQWIHNIHQQYNIRLSVSLPQMASYIFRSMFLRKGDRIEFPPTEVIKPSMLSYHGGKNGLYVPAGVYHNCSEIDINSAYPYAMKQLPSFLKGSYAKTEQFMPNLCGVYSVSGRINCKYNLLFGHDFKALKGEFRNVWLTGYEIEAGLRYKELEIDAISGHVWCPDPSETRNPMGDYVDYFYEQKNITPKSDPMYNFYKLAMNAAYGKFVQCIEKRTLEDMEESDFTVTEKNGTIKVEEKQKYFTAGGLFQPFIATMITAKVRCLLHDLEHKFDAIHSATDSVKTMKNISGATNDLGGYKLEVKGTCILLRNKLYLHYANDFSHCGHKPDDPNIRVKNGQHLCKFALHGFTGRVEELDRLISNRQNGYAVRHMFKIREAIRQRKEPLTMINLLKKFHFDWVAFNKNGGNSWDNHYEHNTQ